MPGMLYHEVKIAETLGGLATKYYGDQSLWTLIYEHNREEIHDVNHLNPGIFLAIPYHQYMRTKVTEFD